MWPEGKLRNSPAATPEAVRVSRRDVSGLHQGMKYALGSEAMSRIRGRPQRLLRTFTRITSAAMTRRNAAATPRRAVLSASRHMRRMNRTVSVAPGQSHSGDRQRGNVHVFSRKREKPASAGGNQAASAGGKKRPERIGSLLLGGGKKHGSRGHDAQRGRVFPETGKKCAESVSGMIQQSGDRRIEERADEHQDQKEAECRQKTGAFFT